MGERRRISLKPESLQPLSYLSELTGDDLLALGVSSVGHRRRLLSAIAAPRDGPRAAASNAPDADPPAKRNDGS